MPKIKYQSFRFSDKTLRLIELCDQILHEYNKKGFDMTLRQLYYQLVSRDIIPNKQSEYKRLGSIVNDARLAGEIDWDHVVDRTRNVRGGGGYTDPAQLIRLNQHYFHLDMWENQEWRPEVWIEKDALAGVFERVCGRLNVPLFSCRGYTSQSEVWGAAQRMIEHQDSGQKPFILHFGDHDPSGIDMSRDIQDRLTMFGVDLQFERMALNMNQIKKYQPPPNPAKSTDSRFAGYIAIHGDESWELDALEPEVLASLVTAEIESIRNEDLWEEREELEEKGKTSLEKISDNFAEVEEFLETIE